MTSGIVGAYAHRVDVTHGLWEALLVASRDRIDIVGYRFLFIWEQHIDLPKLIAEKCAAGAQVRIALADPDCDHVAERDDLEQLGGTLPGRIRNALNHLRDLQDVPGVQIGLHQVHLYPGGSAVVIDEKGRVLLHRRRDSGLWALPGGVMDVGETITDAVAREVREETGVTVEITGLVGIYSDPRHLIAYSDGEVRQQFNICFRARPAAGKAHATDEASEVRWVHPKDFESLDMHRTQRLRLDHALDDTRTEPFLG